MSSYFRAIALDFDGTLTRAGAPSSAVLEAIRRVRARGLITVLVTGRIMAELREVFADVDRHFDAVVAENGATMSIGGSAQALYPAVAAELASALARRGVPYRRGEALLATYSGYESRIQEEIQRLGLECQLVYNRGEVMILPGGASKGAGLLRALEALGVSQHNTIAVASSTRRTMPSACPGN